MLEAGTQPVNVAPAGVLGYYAGKNSCDKDAQEKTGDDD